MGSTALIEALRAQDFQTNCPEDTDGLKHFPDPIAERFLAFAPDRVIYVWGDPLLALLSLDRRGWLEWQRFKITGIPFHFLNLEILWKNTLIAESDVYGLRYHRDLWEEQVQWPLIFFDWRKLESCQTELELFLDLLPGTLALQVKEHALYDLKLIPDSVKEIYARLDQDMLERTRIEAGQTIAF